MEELVDTLSDEDLYYRLKEFKPDLGPVVDSTRSLYKRLLTKALQGDVSAASILNASKDGHEMNLSKDGHEVNLSRDCHEVNLSKDGRGSVEKSGPLTRSRVTAPAEEEDETTEEGSQTEEDAMDAEGDAMDAEDDDFEILDNQELEGEDQYLQRSGADTATAEANNFLIKTVVVGFIFAVLAIIAVAVWIPPTKKDWNESKIEVEERWKWKKDRNQHFFAIPDNFLFLSYSIPSFQCRQKQIHSLFAPTMKESAVTMKESAASGNQNDARLSFLCSHIKVDY